MYSQTISQTIYRAGTAIEDSARNIHAVLEPYADDLQTSSHNPLGIFSADETRMIESPRVLSPDPLPHPYRLHSPLPVGDSTDDDTTESEGEGGFLSPLDMDKDKDNSSAVGDVVGELPTPMAPRPTLARRRSSLKQSNNSSRASLNVAWAMDQEWQDQIKRYEDAASAAEQAGSYIPSGCLNL